MQLLVRFWKPRPQRLLHGDHSVHVDQPPLTAAAQSNLLSDQINLQVNIFYTFHLQKVAVVGGTLLKIPEK